MRNMCRAQLSVHITHFIVQLKILVNINSVIYCIGNLLGFGC
jgi:hypothetical protein